MPEVPPSQRCDAAASPDGRHLCGIQCKKNAEPAVPGVPDAASLSPQCDGFMSALHSCSKSQLTCEMTCKGTWVLVGK